MVCRDKDRFLVGVRSDRTRGHQHSLHAISAFERAEFRMLRFHPFWNAEMSENS
jgi:hypothetical protein